MMEEISVEEIRPFPEAVFKVIVGGEDKTAHTVTVDENYYYERTKGAFSPLELVRKSFEFLLSREGKESILREFDLRDIARYFPEYEQEFK